MNATSMLASLVTLYSLKPSVSREGHVVWYKQLTAYKLQDQWLRIAHAIYPLHTTQALHGTPTKPCGMHARSDGSVQILKRSYSRYPFIHW